MIGNEPPPRRLATGLAKIAIVLRSQAWTYAAAVGLTPTQVQVLQQLAASTRGLRVGELASQLAVTPQTVSDSIAALTRKQLVEKRQDPRDGRFVRIVLTTAGAQQGAASADWPDALLASLDELTTEEREVMLRVVVKMIRRLQQQGRISTARICVTCRFFEPNAHPDHRHPHHCHFVDAAFGDVDLQTDCGDHDPAPATQLAHLWTQFTHQNRPGNAES